MDGVTSMFPADGSTFAGCGTFSKSVQDQMIRWVGDNALKSWNKHPHPAKPGFESLDVFGVATVANSRIVNVRDNSFAPRKLTVDRGATVTWRWPRFDEAGDVHDVALKSGPKGVKMFHSEAASTDYSFKRRADRSGDYTIVCTLHEEMTMTIRVRR